MRLTVRDVRQRPRAARSLDEHLAAAELCGDIVDALSAFQPHDAAIRQLEDAVENARLAALDAAQASLRSVLG